MAKCTLTQKYLCGKLDCETCVSRSCLKSENKKMKELLPYWAEDNDFQPHQLTEGSTRIIKIDCKVCNHRSSLIIKKITQQNLGCIYCSPKTRLCGDHDCEWCIAKSFFGSPKTQHMIDKWSDENKEDPRDIPAGSSDSYRFDCKICKHKFLMCIANISGKGYGCMFCCVNPKFCGKRNCDWCKHRSCQNDARFAHVLSSWSDENEKKPYQVPSNSHDDIILDCKKCEKPFTTKPYYITGRGGKGCPNCKYSYENKLGDWLRENIKHFVDFQAKFDWCKTKEGFQMFFDFCIEVLKLIIEFDGPQHFIQVGKWASPAYNHLRDRQKMRKAIKEGYTVVRVLYSDIYCNNLRWQYRILKHLRKHKIPRAILLDNKGEYDKFRRRLTDKEYKLGLIRPKQRKKKLLTVSTTDSDIPKKKGKPVSGKAKKSISIVTSKRSS